MSESLICFRRRFAMRRLPDWKKGGKKKILILSINSRFSDMQTRHTARRMCPWIETQIHLGEKVGLRRAEYSTPIWPDVQRHLQCCDLDQMEARGHVQANENIREQPLKYEEPFKITPSDAFYFPAYLSENKTTRWLQPRNTRAVVLRTSHHVCTHKEINEETHQSDTFY